MKRGLVRLDPAEIPPAERAARLDAVQQRLRKDGLSAALIYGDVSRSDDIAYLTNLCIYWNEGVLAVPARGEPAFLTKLSKRVHPWMRATSTVEDVRSGRDLAALSADFLNGASKVGVVDARWWPAALFHDLETALPDAKLVALPDLVREARRIPSDSELTLLREGGSILADALNDATRGAREPAERVAGVELATRGAGFADVFVSCATAADGSVSLDATGQFRTLWIRAARVAGAAERPLRETLDTAAQKLHAGAQPHEIGSTIRITSGSPTFSIRCVSHTDLATGGDLRIDGGQEQLSNGEVVTLVAAELTSSGELAVGETYRIARSGIELLTAPAVAKEGHGRMG